jgi:aryl-alcohol dehydrogenase-like predicted oxidoreductase
LRWILDHAEVTCAIPGARNATQAAENAKASDLPLLDAKQLAAVDQIYASRIRPLVHQRW